MKTYTTTDPIPSPSKRNALENTSKIVLLLTVALVLLTIIPLYYYPFLASSFSWGSSTTSTSPPPRVSLVVDRDGNDDGRSKNVVRMVSEECDIFRGEWVPNPKAPYYTNTTCWAIHDHQNCMKFGRPDADFMKWRWKPNDCELPIFNPAQFLEIVRGKSLAFVGDSIGRNHMQSLICLLSRVTYAVDASPTADEKFRRWHYPTHNFTIANFWSPFLVTAREADPKGPTLTGLFDLHLDEPDPSWASHMSDFDLIILSAGHWFFRPTMYYEGGALVGCHYCLRPDFAPDLTMYHGYRMAFRTAFRALKDFGGTVFLRSFAPSHFENGEWNKGGDCVRTGPTRGNETRLDGINLEMYMTQLEEFRAAAAESGARLRLMDTTEAMLMRPDGHPSRYGHPRGANLTMYNDCVHWCLPGPVDTWNDFLLHMLMTARRRKRFEQ